jgi:LysR family transcriptional regulator of gallate degradation
MGLAADLCFLPSLRRLRAFEHVAQTGGLNAAAATLRLSQPAITNSLRALESDVGMRLFNRDTRGSSPTPAGHVLHRRTTRLFNQIESALQAVTGGSPGEVKRLAAKLSTTQIRSLIAIWEAGSYRAAAEQLNCSQPAVHRAAHDFEQSLKSSLFRKTPHGVAMTRTGSELARRFAVAMREVVFGLEELAALAGRPQARLALGCLVLAPKRRLAAASQQVLTRHPDAQLDIREDSYDELTRLLRSGALDMVFGAIRDPLHDDLITEGFFDDPYAIVCRRGHPLTLRRSIAPRDLAAYGWILPTAGLPRRTALERIITEWGLQPRGRIETTSLSTIVAFVAESDRLSLLSQAFFPAGGVSERLVALDLPVPQPPRQVGLTLRSDWLATAFQTEFVSALRAVCTARR